MTDLIERLRDRDEQATWPVSMCEEAAAEIERLRTELAALRHAARHAESDMTDIAENLDLMGRAIAKQRLNAASADLRALLKETP